MTNEARYRRDVHRLYEGDGIVVHWEPSLCIHIAACIRHLPQVFDPQARPWVDVAMAEADDIAEAVRSCPTGALRYERTDGAPQEPVEDPVIVEPRPNGPLFVRGAVEIRDPEGNLTRSASRAALCRCGSSDNKPFCDNSHRMIGFTTE